MGIKGNEEANDDRSKEKPSYNEQNAWGFDVIVPKLDCNGNLRLLFRKKGRNNTHIVERKETVYEKKVMKGRDKKGAMRCLK